MKNTCIELRLKVPQKDIYYISWNLDACEGLGLLQTDDAREGRVTIFLPEPQLNYFLDFIEGHRAEGIDIGIENLDEILESMGEYK